MNELGEINKKLEEITRQNKEVVSLQVWKEGVSEQIAGMEEKIDAVENVLWGKERRNGVVGDVSTFKKLFIWVPVAISGIVGILKYFDVIPK